MLSVVSLCIVALAVSLDGFGVGVMYGLRRISIPFVSIVIISCCSGLIIYGSMIMGEYLSRFLSPSAASIIGAVILILIGVCAVFQVVMFKNENSDSPGNSMDDFFKVSPEDSSEDLIKGHHQDLPIILQILRTPPEADRDRSGNISPSEATVLGIALSLDAFGAGVGAAFIGLTPLLTSTVTAGASGAFIALGLRTGYMFSETPWFRKLTILPGCILVLLGIIKLM